MTCYWPCRAKILAKVHQMVLGMARTDSKQAERRLGTTAVTSASCLARASSVLYGL